jgi:predicted nuclease with TOPRIM domain
MDHTQDLERLNKENKNLRAQLQAAKKRNEELERFVEILNAHIYQQKRLRNLVKNLVHAVDQIITLHLSKITKRPHYYPAMHIPDGSRQDTATLLGIIKTADEKSFQGSPSIGWKVVMMLGTALEFIYVSLRRLLFRSAKFLVKQIRKLRSGAK